MELSRSSVLPSLLMAMLLGDSLGFSRTKSSNKKPTKAQEEAQEGKVDRLRPGYAALIESSFPHPFELGIAWIRPKESSHIISAGYLKKNLAAGNGVRDISIQIQNIEYRYRVEPWERHPLYMQISGAYQQIEVNGTRAITVKQGDVNFTTDVRGQLFVRSLYYTPKVGMTKHFASGLTLSWGFGYLIPALVSAQFNSQIPGDPLLDELLQQLGSYRSTKNELERVGKRVGQVGIPVVDLLEIAFRF